MVRATIGALVATVLVAGCLDRSSTVCGDGRLCATGTVCVAELDLCVDPAQLTACGTAPDGTACQTEAIAVGSCRDGVCLRGGCGNDVVDLAEACDDGNTVAGDGCSADCRSDESCGNGIVDREEQCDCGVVGVINPDCPGPNSATTGTCNQFCELRCGDGVVAPDEGCEPTTPASANVSCAGDVFDRGLTTCSPACQPVISADACRYLGWRTRNAAGVAPVHDAVLIGTGRGFFASELNVGWFDAWVTPLGVFQPGQPAYGVWALDLSTAVAVGAAGMVVRWNGTAWTLEDSGTTEILRDVWGRAGDDIYAVGDAGTVIHWDGEGWASLTPPVATALWAVAGDAARTYVVGDGGTVLALDGGGWEVLDAGTTADLRGVWSAAGVVVTVGDGGTIRVDDGTGWVAGLTLSTVELRSVWGSASDGFFAVGDRGTILFRDGEVWRPMSLGRGVTTSVDQALLVVGGVAGEVVSILGEDGGISYEGAAWSPVAVPTAETIYGLWGSSSRDVFAVGRHGTILHHDGLTWTAQAAGTTVDLHAVWGSGPTDVYAVGDDLTLLHHDGGSWTTLHAGAIGALDGALLGVFVAPTGDVFAAGTDGIFRWDGAALVLDFSTTARAVWGTSAANVWAVGADLRHFTGSTWVGGVQVELNAISGRAADDVYVVGVPNARYDGTIWRVGPFVDGDLSAVTSSDLGVFAAGHTGKLRRWDGPGAAVEPIVSRTTADLTAMFAAGNVVFMAGVDGTLDQLIFQH